MNGVLSFKGKMNSLSRSTKMTCKGPKSDSNCIKTNSTRRCRSMSKFSNTNNLRISNSRGRCLTISTKKTKIRCHRKNTRRIWQKTWMRPMCTTRPLRNAALSLTRETSRSKSKRSSVTASSKSRKTSASKVSMTGSRNRVSKVSTIWTWTSRRSWRNTCGIG